VTPAGADLGSEARTDLTFTASGRALRPLAPVHIRARRAANGDIALTWIRRARQGGDSWTVEEVPLAETAEAYRLQVMDGAVVKRTVDLTSPAYLYPTSAWMTDFGGAPSTLSIRLAQVAPGFGAGIWRAITLPIET
jgi:hypothetical protein